jgi:hypothetical protein
MPKKPLAVNRFVVMAMLQAARARTLGLPKDAAYSWGLNRAIFYAAAKRGFRGSAAASGGASGEPPKETTRPTMYRLGDDDAFQDPEAGELVFKIGDRPQTAAEFERQIAGRFGSKKNFQAAWAEAVQIVEEHDRATLESRSRFYGEVYKPRRDALKEKWAREYGTADEPG